MDLLLMLLATGIVVLTVIVVLAALVDWLRRA